MEELDGQYAEVGGRGLVTFIRSYPVGAAGLWAAVSTSEGLEGWFPSRTTLDPAARTVSLSGDPNMEPSSGRILDWEPPRRWVFDWGGDALEFIVEGTAAEGELTLRNWLAEPAAAARNAAGWHVCLGRRARSQAGRPRARWAARALGPQWPARLAGALRGLCRGRAPERCLHPRREPLAPAPNPRPPFRGHISSPESRFG